MEVDVTLDSVCSVSEDVVAREIQGELIIIPLTSGIGDMEDEFYSLNDTGRAIWSRLDGNRTLSLIAADLAAEFDASVDEIEKDVLGLVRELVRSGILAVV